MSGPSNAPVIIKRKKVVAGGGHHGGAWKVAYADFVTAMMAFFLLMWLLGATNEKQRKGIADFFNPTIPLNKVSGGGDGAFGGDSVFSDQTLAHNGSGTVMKPPTSDNDDKAFAEIERDLAGIGGESMVSELLAKHVTSRITDEGLIVEVFDREASPLFDDTGTPTGTLRELLTAIAEVFLRTENEIAVQGHVAAVPLVMRENPVWETSTERAEVARGILEESGIVPPRFQRVTGFADRRPVSSNPLSGRNNRLEIILLRSRV